MDSALHVCLVLAELSVHMIPRRLTSIYCPLVVTVRYYINKILKVRHDDITITILPVIAFKINPSAN